MALPTFMSALTRPRETLSRNQRLRSSGDFFRLKEQGKRHVQGCLIMNWQPSLPDGSTRLGVVTSRRIGGAVVRNRARRLLREVFRRNRFRMVEALAVVLVARPSIAAKDYRQVEHDFVEALRRARLLAPEPPVSPTGSSTGGPVLT